MTAKTAELLVELYSEEIPAGMQQAALEAFSRLLAGALKGAGIAFTEKQAWVTPRRLTLVLDDIPVIQPDRSEERKGPKVGAPDGAIEGFLKSAGLQGLDQCQQQDTPKGPVWVAVSTVKGGPTSSMLPGLLADAIGQMSWPKSMRWGTGRKRWVRPLQHVLAVFNGKKLDGAVDMGGGIILPFTDHSRGHRFMAPGAFPVSDSHDYLFKLSEAQVVLDHADRRRVIAEEAAARAQGEGLVLPPDPALVEEVAGLVEWPVVLMGRIDDIFMDLPPEVRTTAMRAHQRYFTVHNPDGTAAPRFVVVAGTETEDGGDQVIAGNERVLRARLSDARFFWDQDRKAPLADRVPSLADIVFHAKLGSLHERVDRMQALAAEIAAHVPGADKAEVRSAAFLCKADLVTGMVGEFPELQGVMGRYYALAQGEAPEIADAIAGHYKPQGPNDACPCAPVTVCLALAEKIDTLAGFFAIGETPTGSKDPYALRRAALGVIRLVIENGLRLGLGRIFARAVSLHVAGGKLKADPAAVAAQLMGFIADRVRVALKDKGVRHDLIDAVFALAGEDDLVRLLARVESLQKFLGTEDGENLLAGYRRAANIVRIEAKKDDAAAGAGVSAALFKQPEEEKLWHDLHALEGQLPIRLKQEEFDAVMGDLAGLRPVIDTFFDKVTVNAEEPRLRLNRLALLNAITLTMNQVADFSRIEG